MSTIAYCNELLFDKYKSLFQNLDEAIETYKESINTVENCLDFKDYVIYLAKLAEVGEFMQLVKVNLSS